MKIQRHTRLSSDKRDRMDLNGTTKRSTSTAHHAVRYHSVVLSKHIAPYAGAAINPMPELLAA